MSERQLEGAGRAASARERFVSSVSSFLLRCFFRRIEVLGADRIPQSGPFLVVANHVNGLLDPMFVFGPLRIAARTIGKAPLWKIPVIGQLATLAGGIPVHRRHDAGSDPAKNVEAFRAAHDVLAAGGRIAIFPEGISHDLPRLQKLKTGAARIVLEAERERGPLGTRIVPVGLVFERREAFRSSALVVVGEPIDPAAEIEQAKSDERAAAHALTEKIATAIEAVTLNYESWEEARLVELGATLWARRSERPAPRGGGRRLIDEFALRRAVDDGLGRLRSSHPDEVAEAVAATRAYERLLNAAHLTDEQVATRLPWRLAFGLFALSASRLLLISPVALLGTALNLVPWTLVHSISRLVRHLPNQVATYTVFPGLVLYPATWIAAGWQAGKWLGALSGVAVGVLGPVAGWIALRWHERRRTLWSETRAFLILRGRKSLAAELHARRERVERASERLAERL